MKKFIAQCTDNTITPPCRSFRLLVLVKDYDKAISEFENIKSKAELEAVGQRYKLYKGAHKDLITMCKGATLRLTDASKRATEEADSQKAKEDKKSAKKAKKEGPEKGAYFEVLFTSLKQVPTCRLDDEFKPVLHFFRQISSSQLCSVCRPGRSMPPLSRLARNS